jgi:hypothetical protein
MTYNHQSLEPTNLKICNAKIGSNITRVPFERLLNINPNVKHKQRYAMDSAAILNISYLYCKINVSIFASPILVLVKVEHI